MTPTSPGWIVTEIVDGMLHVLPIDDAAGHVESPACPCNPRVEIIRNRLGQPVRNVIHDAFDGRQILERAVGAAREGFGWPWGG